MELNLRSSTSLLFHFCPVELAAVIVNEAEEERKRRRLINHKAIHWVLITIKGLKWITHNNSRPNLIRVGLVYTVRKLITHKFFTEKQTHLMSHWIMFLQNEIVFQGGRVAEEIMNLTKNRKHALIRCTTQFDVNWFSDRFTKHRMFR